MKGKNATNFSFQRTTPKISQTGASNFANKVINSYYIRIKQQELDKNSHFEF